MGLSPGEMHARIIENLTEKTGHALDHWLGTLNAFDGNKKAKLAHLKADYGMGHYTAIAILREHLDDVPWRHAARLEAALFAGLTPAEQKTLERLRAGIAADGVDVVPCKTYLGFRGKSQFAVIRPAGKAGLELGLTLDPSHDPALQEAKGLGSMRIRSKLLVEDVDLALRLAKRAQEA